MRLYFWVVKWENTFFPDHHALKIFGWSGVVKWALILIAFNTTMKYQLIQLSP